MSAVTCGWPSTSFGVSPSTQVGIRLQKEVQLGLPLCGQQVLQAEVAFGPGPLAGRRHPTQQRLDSGAHHALGAQVVAGQLQQSRRVVLQGAVEQEIVEGLQLPHPGWAPPQPLHHCLQVALPRAILAAAVIAQPGGIHLELLGQPTHRRRRPPR